MIIVTTIKEFFDGKKTKIGAILLIVSGGLYIGGLYDPMLYDIGTGLSKIGMGLIAWGIHTRITKGLCNIHDGKIQYNSMRLQPPSVMGE